MRCTALFLTSSPASATRHRGCCNNASGKANWLLWEEAISHHEEAANYYRGNPHNNDLLLGSINEGVLSGITSVLIMATENELRKHLQESRFEVKILTEALENATKEIKRLSEEKENLKKTLNESLVDKRRLEEDLAKSKESQLVHTHWEGQRERERR